MGKNHGKHGKKTEYQRWESAFAKIRNEVEKEKKEMGAFNNKGENAK